MQYGPARKGVLDDILAESVDDLFQKRKLDEWKDFVPSALVPINHPWLTRYASSALPYFDNGVEASSNNVYTGDHEIYGSPAHPILFRVGTGSAGYSGVWKILCSRYIERHGADFSIGAVRNNSRHTQVALLADIVQVALTQQTHNEDLAIAEGWCLRGCRVFNDHFILTGPSSNPAGVEVGGTLKEALRTMASRGSDQPYNHVLFASHGDGSGTFFKKQQLLVAAGLDVSGAKWTKKFGPSPPEALKMAAKEGSYLLTNRSTYLTAKHLGLIPSMRVYVEGEPDLVNPCSAMLHTKTDHAASRAAALFAKWLSGEEAQSIIRGYGKDWSYGRPLFTIAEQSEFEEHEYLAGRL